MKLINKANNTVISENVMVADTFFRRLRGLMFTKTLPEENALHIEPCNGVHTFNMRYSIDILYLDKSQIILAVDEDMRPWRIGRFVNNAVAVVELPRGRVKKMCIKTGQAVQFME